MFDIRDYGAKGDRQSNDQEAIQTAIDACSAGGGGTVMFPAGNYLSGEIRLRSRVTLHMEAGATLWASLDPSHYEGDKRGHLLLAENEEQVSIIGQGVIHGQGTDDYGSLWGVPDKPSFRVGILEFTSCKHVTIRDVTVLYSDAWTLHLKRCEIVTIDGVTILNNRHRLNSDGIDPNSCRHVHISNCHIVAGDDCIVLKSTEPHPCEDVVVTNCTLETTCAALKLGTESFGDYRNIHFANCTIRNTPVGIAFYMKDGATVEGISFANISVETSPAEVQDVFPIFMDIEKRHADSPVGRIRDVIFRDILIRSGSGVLIQGMPEQPIENVIMENILFRVDHPDEYAERRKPIGGKRTTEDERDTQFARLPSYLTAAHVQGFFLDTLRLIESEEAAEKCEKSAFCGCSIEEGLLRSVTRHPAKPNADTADVVIHRCERLHCEGSPHLRISDKNSSSPSS